jgi:hypothetical protein
MSLYLGEKSIKMFCLYFMFNIRCAHIVMLIIFLKGFTCKISPPHILSAYAVVQINNYLSKGHKRIEKDQNALQFFRL